jgi:hypothetical protein
LSVMRPDIAAQWHPTLNGELKPDQVTTGMQRKVWWLCEKGHEWSAEVASRTRGRGCPYCAKQKTLTGVNDLATLRPDVASQWHPMLNDGLKSSQVTVGSNRKVWWLCERGHEWNATVADRTQGHGCPYCAGKKTLKEYNDLATLRPDISAQWHPVLNGQLKPDQVAVGTARKVWWLCERGHEWEAAVGNRTSGRGCATCSRAKRSGHVLAHNDSSSSIPIKQQANTDKDEKAA